VRSLQPRAFGEVGTCVAGHALARAA
jgi:hypothetical protein